MRNIVALIGVAAGMLLVSSPAFARPIAVPEPFSLSLLAGGVVALAAVRHMRRK
jgi:hypothetical protein